MASPTNTQSNGKRKRPTDEELTNPSVPVLATMSGEFLRQLGGLIWFRNQVFESTNLRVKPDEPTALYLYLGDDEAKIRVTVDSALEFDDFRRRYGFTITGGFSPSMTHRLIAEYIMSTDEPWTRCESWTWTKWLWYTRQRDAYVKRQKRMVQYDPIVLIEVSYKNYPKILLYILFT